MERRGFLKTLAGVFGAFAAGQAVKLSDLKSLVEPVAKKVTGYRTYIFGSKAIQGGQILYDKELIANLKGESVFSKAAVEGTLPGWQSYRFRTGAIIPAEGINRTFFQYDTLGSNTLPGKTHECILDEANKCQQ